MILNPLCSLPASLRWEGRMPTSETGEDWPLSQWHWVVWQTWQPHCGAPSSVTGDRVVLLWEVKSDLEAHTCVSQGWALLLEVTTKKVTLTTHLAAGKCLKLHMWPFSDTQECAQYDVNNFTLSFALLFSKTSPFKTHSSSQVSMRNACLLFWTMVIHYYLTI